MTPSSYHFEISSSADGGRTWVKEFIAQLTRLKKGPDHATANPPGNGPEHDFDFNIGAWNTQIRAVENPLSAPNVWRHLQGTHVVYRLRGETVMARWSDDPQRGEGVRASSCGMSAPIAPVSISRRSSRISAAVH